MILQEDYKPLEDKFSETWPENVSWQLNVPFIW